ncbi:MAG: LPS assembly protein LptD [Candidatus Omnitrophica bacterium]|nr:LPS assembly protein LptD [Candidatus Omnitrophota bacterium]MBU1924904.1 LPS assembly protein LptD [Candidatus Omnitrophota bacterium]
MPFKTYRYVFACCLFAILLGVLLVILACPALSYAKDEKSNASFSALTDSKKPVVVDADTVEYFDEQNKIVGQGNVKIDYEDVRLVADYVQVDMKTQEAQAQGNVVVTQQGTKITGDKLTYFLTTKKGVIIGEEKGENKVESFYEDVRIVSKRIDFDLASNVVFVPDEVEMFEGALWVGGRNLSYDFNTKKGTFSDIKFKDPVWQGQAPLGEKINEEQINFTRGYMTTCDREKPHYRIQSRRIQYYIGEKVVAKNILIFVGKVPLLYFPYWSQSLKDKRSMVTVIVGHKKTWGSFVLTAWKYHLNDNFEGRIHLDQREYKGFASGLDADYKLPGYGGGKIKTYYMNERDKYIKSNEYEEYAASGNWDKFYEITQERERYRGQLKYRWDMDYKTLAIVEYNKVHDIDFMKEYFYREYEKNAQPATQGYVTRAEENYNLSLSAQKRTQHFYSEVERLPELALNMTSREVGETNLYYAGEFVAANLNKKTADTDADTDANRFNTYNELKYPTKLPGALDWINFTPYTATRQTYYSKDTFGERRDFIRGVHYYGFGSNAKFYRIFDVNGDLLGIEYNRLRHILTPSVQYTYIHSPTVPTEKLGAFDLVDSVSRANYFTFGLENQVQTKWKKGKDSFESVDLIYLYPSVNYIHRVDPGGRHFSSITNQLNIKPYRWLYLETSSTYNQYQRRFDTAKIDFSVSSDEEWRVTLGKRYDRDISELITTDIFYKINRFWQTRVYGRYETYTRVWEEYEYTIFRDLHCWLLEISYNLKNKPDGTIRDKTFWLIFRLKAFPEETPITYNMGRDAMKQQNFFGEE